MSIRDVRGESGKIRAEGHRHQLSARGARLGHGQYDCHKYCTACLG
jgi:hypothetical protein